MRWPSWSLWNPTEKNEDDHHTQLPSLTSLAGNDEDASKPTRPSTWNAPILPSDWRTFLEPQTVVAAGIMTSTFLVGRWMYNFYLRRITGATRIDSSFWRKRSLLGQVTSVGDGDGFRLFHTPGGRLAGWGWLPWRKVPKGKALKDNTISIRIAGVDAPEAAHFGHPAQPGGPEAMSWLTSYVLGRRVRAYIHRKDQYDRAVATAYVYFWGGLWRKDIGLEMLHRGHATIYEAKTGKEFGGKELTYRKAEGWAKIFRRGIWRDGENESPRQYKDRQKAGEDGEKSKGKQEDSLISKVVRSVAPSKVTGPTSKKRS